MNRPLKTTFALAALALVALAVSASPAAAAKPKTACWKLVINDWYDGTISGKYKLHCYRDALGHLNPDLEGYSSARDDIRRALNQRIAEIAAAKKKQQAAPAKNNSGPSGPTSGSSGPTPPPPPAVVGGASGNKGHSKTNKHSTGGSNSAGNNSTKPQGPKVGVAPGSKSATAQPTTPGRNTGEGPATRLINRLGPDDATSLPIPLLVLAGLAMLLMFGGAITLVAKRAQARRLATVPVRSAESR